MRPIVLLLVALPLLGGGLAEGNRLYRSGRFRQAAEVYARRMEKGDTSAVVRYNLGTALLRLSRWDQARPLLEAAADGRSAPELRQRAHYNAGNADLDPVFQRKAKDEERADRLRRAIGRYRRALTMKPGDFNAKWNLELAQRLLDEEERSGGGGGGGEDEQEGGGGQDEQDTQPQPTPQGESAPQIDRSQAEDILAGAEREERDAQRDLLERSTRPQRKPLRDW